MHNSASAPAGTQKVGQAQNDEASRLGKLDMLADHRKWIREVLDEAQRVHEGEPRQVGQVACQSVAAIDSHRQVEKLEILLELAAADRRAVDRVRFIAKCPGDVREVAARSASDLDSTAASAV